MRLETKSVLVNALPLLVLAGAYLAVPAALLGPRWRDRGRLTLGELALASVLPAIAVAAATLGIAVLLDPAPLAGRLWSSFAAIAVALVPPALVLARRREVLAALAAGPRGRGAQARISLLDRELEAVSSISSALGRVEEPREVARILLDKVREVLGVEFASLALVSDDGTLATGLLAVGDEGEVPWWRDLTLDLAQEPSAIASAAFEGAPIGIFDVQESAIANRRIAEAVGARSAAFVPLVASGGVAGVLVAASTGERRAFTPGELALLEALAAEAALSLARTRASAALAEALERERLLADVARRVRSELDVDSVLQAAVARTGRALEATRCFIRLGEDGGALSIAAEWAEAGRDPLGPAAEGLPDSSLAARERRTVAVGDLEADPRLEERSSLLELGTRALLATPIVVFERMSGVLALHRAEAGEWSSGEVALAEAVSHEIGLAVHTARLLEENRTQLAQQRALLEAARVLTGELRLETVVHRLVEELAKLLECEIANCCLIDPTARVFRCAAVVGLPQAVLGFEFPLDRGLAARAVAEGRPVRSDDHGTIELPVPDGEREGLVGAIVAPMTWSGETRGVLAVGSRDPGRRFDAGDAELLEGFAGLAALALRNAESYELSARQARIERGFSRVASLLGDPLSLPETLDAVAQAACVSLGGAGACVLIPGGEGLTVAGSHALDVPVLEAARAGAFGSAPALLLAAGEGRILASPELARDDRFGDGFREVLGGAYRSLLAVPVQVPRSAQYGLVIVVFVEEHAFTDDDLELAGHLAQAARGALERSDLFETERHARALSQQLARSGSKVATELDPAAVLDEVVERAPALLGVEAGAVWVTEGDDLVVVAVSGDGLEGVLGARVPAELRAVGDAAQAQVPVVLASVAEVPRLQDREPILALGFSGFLGVPLTLPEGQGVLAVYSRQVRPWRQEEVESLVALAANASAAFANAELYQRVAQEKERSVAILANIADGIVAVDREGEVVLWNAAAERITGVPVSEALGREPAQVLQRRLESTEDAPVGNRFVSIARGTEEVWLSLTEAVMRDPAGGVSGRIFAFRDISSDRAVEQMKSDFVLTVSHELRTPLTSIYGFAETLLRSDVAFSEEERRTFLGYIASEAERLTAIVDALLNVARLDTGDLVVHAVPMDVRGVVSEVVAGVSEASGDNGHRFVVDLPAEPLDAHADREKLRQILGQLVDNAIKYSPSGATVTIQGSREGESVRLAVADEGVGIPQSEQERIFRKFYRAGDPAGRLPGTGLGLFIAHGLVAAMGGRIWVDSTEGLGSTFAVELPSVTVED
ncbi:MAG: GAF domain-containing protein [Gaiellaceae bacterium]